MRRRTALGALASFAAMSALSGCGTSDEASYRFRITVEVETPQGLRTGSAVMEESAAYGDFVLSETGKGKGSLHGEAVTVELPNGPLFVLLKIRDAKGGLGGKVTDALSGGVHSSDFDAYFKKVRALGGWFGGAKAELPREDWPMMVQFRDLSNPASIEEVDPESAGVKRIALETTSESITRGIDKRLPWLENLERYRTNPSNPFTNDLPSEIGSLRNP